MSECCLEEKLQDLKFVFRSQSETVLEELEAEIRSGKREEECLSEKDLMKLKNFIIIKESIGKKNMVKRNMEIFRKNFHSTENLQGLFQIFESNFQVDLVEDIKKRISAETNKPLITTTKTYKSQHNPFSNSDHDRSEAETNLMWSNFMKAAGETNKTRNDDEFMEPEKLKVLRINDINEIKYEEVNGTRTLLGEGGQAKVYKAIFKNQVVAVKEFKNINRKDIMRECKSLAVLSSPYIIKILGYAFDSCSDSYCIIMEYAHFGSLQQLIKNENNLEWEKLKRIINGIFSGICSVHEKNIIHRDIKSANILIDMEYNPKLSDFGIAKEEVSNSYNNTVLEDGRGIGSKKYMAPEVNNYGKYSQEADIWSLGVLMNELLEKFKENIPVCYQNFLLEIINKCKNPEPEKRIKIFEIISKFNDVKSEKSKQLTVNNNDPDIILKNINKSIDLISQDKITLQMGINQKSDSHIINPNIERPHFNQRYSQKSKIIALIFIVFLLLMCFLLLLFDNSI